MAEPPVSVDTLPPTQYLVLEVLTARARLGEHLWTFPSRLTPAAEALSRTGLVWWKGGSEPHTIRVALTETGQAACLHHSYEPPDGGIARLRRALEDIAAYAERRADSTIGMDSIADTARHALKLGPTEAGPFADRNRTGDADA